jgi:hypothetical protein
MLQQLTKFIKVLELKVMGILQRALYLIKGKSLMEFIMEEGYAVRHNYMSSEFLQLCAVSERNKSRGEERPFGVTGP